MKEVLYFNNLFFPKAHTGEFFEQEVSFAQEKGVAFETDGVYFASGLNRGGAPIFLTKEEIGKMTLKNWVAKAFGDKNPVSETKNIGVAYKRMCRPIVTGGQVRTLYSTEALTSSLVSLKILLSKMERLFETVEPAPVNLSTYGHQIRELLLLACMEVESSWAAVLQENGYTSKRDFSTNDYVKLAEPMFLDVYELSLWSYPNFPPFFPFKGWDPSAPTTSLGWYDSYNKTKHDRENNLPLATFENAIKAVGAALVMFSAQFGMRPPIPGASGFPGPIQNTFKFHSLDMSRYEKDFYIPKMHLETSMPRAQQARDSGLWVLSNFPY